MSSSENGILLITLILSFLILVYVFVNERKDEEEWKKEEKEENYCVDISGGYKSPCRDTPLGMCTVKEIEKC